MQARAGREVGCLLIAALLGGCTFRELRIDATVSAYDVRPLRGQGAGQMETGIRACRDMLINEPGQMEPRYLAAPAWWEVGIQAERGQRYERCLAERGYETELRPMRDGAQPVR